MNLLAIDGNSILNRAFYGIKALSNSSGQATNAITGFFNIYLKEIAQVKPDYIAVAFDRSEKTFRHKAVESYKANRHGMPDELASQLPIVKEILGYMGIKVVECAGYEADDIIGTLAETFEKHGVHTHALTGDRDYLQLVDENITVRLAKNKGTEIYDTARIKKEYSLEPKDLIELKALMGDSSDNISGVKGIGEKTALKLVQEFKTLENLYEQLEESKLTKSVKQKLKDGKEDAFQSRWLGTIVKDAPIDADINNYIKSAQDNKKLSEILVSLECFKLREKLIEKNGSSTKTTSKNLTSDNDGQISFEQIMSENQAVKDVEFSENADGINSEKPIYFILNDEQLYLENDEKYYLIKDEDKIKNILAGKSKKYTFDGKTAYKYAMSRGSRLENLVFSADLAGYLLSSQSTDYSIEGLCLKYNCSYWADNEKFVDILFLKELCSTLYKELENNDCLKVFEEIEMPLCKVLASMELVGVQVDTDGVKKFGENLSVSIEKLANQIYTLAGKEFKILSPKQLGTVLFEDLGLPAKKKTKTGYSTNVEVLEELQYHHEIVPLILEYRTLCKLNSTYVEGLLKQVGKDGRVHSIFRQTETRTGRISSAEPNMQNIPVRKPIGRQMRKFFVAKQGCKIVDADYSQIELRVLAQMCGDENMQKLFKSDSDIHTATAASVFGVPQDFVTEDMRRNAKAVNFGIIYGIGAFSLSKDIGVSVGQAKEFINNYYAGFPKVKQFMENIVTNALKDGYVTTAFGRKRHIPELFSGNKNIQAFGKRAAMNAPIQGTAADIIKIAMIKVYNKLAEELPEARLILQVHDELIIEVPEEQAEQAEQILQYEMENAVQTAVKLKVDAHTGDSWFGAKK